MTFLKKHGSTILMLAFLALILIPQTGMPIKVALNRILAFGPSTLDAEDRTVLTDMRWTLVDLEGNRIDLDRSKGRPVLINMWATWCPPCVAEMPSLQRLYDDYQGSVDFYFISQEDPAKLQTFLEKKEYDLPVFRPGSKPPAGLEFSALPTTYLIDIDGTILIREEGAARWDAASVRELLDDLN